MPSPALVTVAQQQSPTDTEMSTPHSQQRKKRHHNAKDRTKVDLALPSVIITGGMSKERRRKQWHVYRFLAAIGLCLMLLFRFASRTIQWGFLPLANDGSKVLNYRGIHNRDDLKLLVDHVENWCREDEEETCTCAHPLHPEGRQEDSRWERVHHVNVDAVKAAAGALDVLFLGDSITEGWKETFYNQRDQKVAGSLHVFQHYFSKNHGAKYFGLPCGIAGDTTPSLLWRILNGEIPDPLTTRQPAVFWVLVGTNDLHHYGCAPMIVVLGIIRIVEELLFQSPNATVVVNGILPRTFNKAGYVMRPGDSKNLPVLWPTIKFVNRELERYASGRERVEYFETRVFFKNPRASEKELQIDESLMSDFLHPSAKGYSAWAPEIIAKLDSLIGNAGTDSSPD